MQILSKYHSISDSISEWSGRLVIYLILPMFLVPFAESIIMRTMLNKPTIWGLETTTFIFGVYFVLGGAYCLLYKRHVSMDLVYTRLGVWGRAIFDFITYLSIIAFCAVVVWLGTRWAYESTLLLETTSTAWAPVIWPIRWTVPIGGALLIIQALSNLILSIETLVRKEAK